MSERDDASGATSIESCRHEDLPFAADTGPLIALARVDQLQLLAALFGDGVIPPAVYREAHIESGLPGAKRIGEALAAGWLRVVAPLDDGPVADLLRVVDAGEAEAMALCLHRQARLLVIDAAKGRKVAGHAGIPLVGVAGVLLAAKSKGLIGAVGPVLDELTTVGYRLSRQFIDGVRRRANE